MSLPHPRPAFRNLDPIRSSSPIPRAIVWTSALGVRSAMFAIVLTKLTFVARNALLAYLISSVFSNVKPRVERHLCRDGCIISAGDSFRDVVGC